MRDIVEIIEDFRKGKELSQAERPIALAYIQGKYDAVRELNLVGNSNKWIPVSEQLPEKSGQYWCTFGGTNLTGSDYYTTESDAKEMFDEFEEYVGWRSQNVIAWMPLPPSYNTERERGRDMTREEVKQILTLYSDDFADIPEYDEMCEACKIAINSLDEWDKVSKEISFEMKFADGDYYKGLKFANDMLNIIFDKKIKEESEE